MNIFGVIMELIEKQDRKKGVLYARNLFDRQEVMKYLSDIIDKNDKIIADYKPHINLICTSLIDSYSKDFKDSIEVLKQWETFAPKKVRYMLTEESIAERIYNHIVQSNEDYSKICKIGKYDEILILDEKEKIERNPVIHWYNQTGAKFIDVQGTNPLEKAEFIYLNSIYPNSKYQINDIVNQVLNKSRIEQHNLEMLTEKSA